MGVDVEEVYQLSAQAAQRDRVNELKAHLAVSPNFESVERCLVQTC